MYELALFPDWYIGRHLERKLSAAQAKTLAEAFG
jgi:aminoglycoside/choline kinase family phosphotransferase